MNNKGIVDIDKLDNDMKSVADAIRMKSKGSSQLDWPQGFIDEIGKIKSGGGYLDIENPNQYRPYSDKLIATFNSVSDVDEFCNKFNYDNCYDDGTTKLSCGNRIQINDGTYNQLWMIGGFDLEYKQKAADGTIYDNGYGIMLVPVGILNRYVWNINGNTQSTRTGYIGSDVHKFLDSTVSPNLKKVLGDHMVNRNVLLSNSTNFNVTNGYAWTKAYATLMSARQLNVEFAGKYQNNFDDGEATYMLPVFNHISYINKQNYWLRSIAYHASAYYVYGYPHDNGNTVTIIGAGTVNHDGYGGIRPLIYIR